MFSIVIGQGNAAPIANPDGVFNVYQPQPVRIASAALLANDTDADTEAFYASKGIDRDSDVLKVESVGQAAHGTVSLDATTGVITYTPVAGYTGADQFIYTVGDRDPWASSTSAPKSTTSGVVNVYVTDTYAGYTQGSSGDDSFNGGKTKGDSYFGGDGSDTIVGSIHGGSYAGGAGNDTLIGVRGSNTLEGNEGDDRIIGGIKDDLISGGTGSDLLTGGKGNDTFIFNTGDGADTITDFEAHAPSGRPGDIIQIDVDGINNYEQLMAAASEQDGGVLFAFGNGDQFFLQGTLLAALDNDSFTFV